MRKQLLFAVYHVAAQVIHIVPSRVENSVTQLLHDCYTGLWLFGLKAVSWGCPFTGALDLVSPISQVYTDADARAWFETLARERAPANAKSARAIAARLAKSGTTDPNGNSSRTWLAVARKVERTYNLPSPD